MKHINLYIAVSMLAISACNKEQVSDTTDDVLSPQEVLPINIVTDEAAYTRATQATTINEGEKVYVFADKSSDGSEYFGAWELTSDGTGKLTSQEVKNYPTDGSTLDFYGIHGNFGDAIKSDVSFPSTDITHTVKTNQTQTADYCVSDLLYAVKKDVASSTDPITISFYHMLSKVEVALIPGDGFSITDLNKATVEILNTVNIVDFTPEKNIDMGGQTNRAGLLQVSGTIAPITMPTVVNAIKTEGSYGEAVVVPQTLENKEFIKITLKNGNVYTVSSGKTLKLESGKKYTYDLTIASYGITVSSSITDWEEEEITGNAIKYIGDKMPEKAQIGDFYMNDGSLVSGSADLTAEQKAACIGIVFQTDVSRISLGAKAALDKKGVKPHGLVMALKNAKQDGTKKSSWSNNSNELVMSNRPSTVAGFYADINGYEKTNYVFELGNFDATSFEIFFYTSRFGAPGNITEAEAAPENTTGWFVPSIGQWWDIMTNLGKINLDSYKEITANNVDVTGNLNETLMDNTNAALAKTGEGEYDAITTDSHYFMSTEFNESRACRISYKDKISISHTTKTYTGYVRPVLAF